MGRWSIVAAPVVVVVLLTGCSSVSAPDPPDASAVRVSGHVVAYSGPSEFAAIGGASLFGWVEAGGRGRATGQIPLTASGRFSIKVERGARVRLYAGGNTGNEIYQPCAVTVDAVADVSRDVRVVDDYDVIGAAIPPVFLERTRILSGQVYEVVEGRRQPVAFATVSVGGYQDFGNALGWPIANTRTDADGRYIICGLDADTWATVYVVNPIHGMFVSEIELTGDTVLDVEVFRTTKSAPAYTCWARVGSEASRSRSAS